MKRSIPPKKPEEMYPVVGPPSRTSSIKVTTQPEFFWTNITETDSIDRTSDSDLNANVKQDEERQEMDSFDTDNLIE